MFALYIWHPWSVAVTNRHDAHIQIEKKYPACTFRMAHFIQFVGIYMTYIRFVINVTSLVLSVKLF